jgi:hypothetical protein
MKGDFTRSTFDPRKHYSAVLMQQGRVQLDADWNEQLDISAHRVETETIDVIGVAGAPMHNGGFAVSLTPDGSDLALSPGRVYVDGILVELDPSSVAVLNLAGATLELEALTIDGRGLAAEEWIEILHDAAPIQDRIDLVDAAARTITLQSGAPAIVGAARVRRLATVATQHDLPGSQIPGAGSHAVVLDVWERHITAHEDPDLREIALGGPDTATRSQIVAQVKLLELADFAGPLNCGNIPDWRALLPQRNGRLRARARPEDASSEPCLTPAGAGYRRLENQLYRVEVHRVREDGSATFKWSRDNGSVVTDWLGKSGSDLQVRSLGRDTVLGFRSATWAELIDDTHELRGEPGTLVRVIPSSAADNTLTIDQVQPAGSTTDYADFPRHPKLRRWDSTGEVEIALAPDNDGYLKLEGGVEVRFEMDGGYQPGDYWLIPARTAIGDEGGDILWPRDLSNANDPQPLALLPQGVEHHSCLLAVWQVGNQPQDCLPEFPPLTELTTLLYESGDGQEAMPGAPLPQPLRVRVVNGQAPVFGAQVLFTNLAGGGSLSVGGPVATASPDGITECGWTLGGSGAQQVRAELLDAGGQAVPGQVVHFNANLSVASQVSYDPANCAELANVRTVQEAIDALCQRPAGSGCCTTVGEGGEFPSLDAALSELLARGERDICLCLLHGDHGLSLPEIRQSPGEPNLHVKITGAGLGSRVHLQRPLLVAGVRSLALHDLAIEVEFEAEGERGAMAFEGCGQVTLSGCFIVGATLAGEEVAGGALVSLSRIASARLRDVRFEARTRITFDVLVLNLREVGAELLVRTMRFADRGDLRFRREALNAGAAIAGFNDEERTQFASQMARLSRSQAFSDTEQFTFQKLRAAALTPNRQPEDYAAIIIDLRRATVKARPGVALVLGPLPEGQTLADIEFGPLDRDNFISIESCEIGGDVGLYGLPVTPATLAQMLPDGLLADLQGTMRNGNILLGDGSLPLGTLEMRGNQLLRLGLALRVVDALSKMFDFEGILGFFNELLLTDNVVDGFPFAVAALHCGLASNQFLARVGQDRWLGMVVGQTGVTMGNRGEDSRLWDITQFRGDAANVRIFFS